MQQSLCDSPSHEVSEEADESAGSGSSDSHIIIKARTQRCRRRRRIVTSDSDTPFTSHSRGPRFADPPQSSPASEITAPEDSPAKSRPYRLLRYRAFKPDSGDHAGAHCQRLTCETAAHGYVNISERLIVDTPPAYDEVSNEDASPDSNDQDNPIMLTDSSEPSSTVSHYYFILFFNHTNINIHLNYRSLIFLMIK